MEITASQQLGALGVSESQPAIVDWQWFYLLPNLAMWLVAVASLGLRLILRGAQDWLLIIAMALTFILFQIEGASTLVGSLVVFFIVVWLIRQRRETRIAKR